MARASRAIEVIRRGPRGGTGRPPILLVHGAWHGAWCWDRGFMDDLASRGHEVAAVSLRGHGGSWGRGGFATRLHGLAGYVDDVASVAATFGRPPVLVGHSMGGFVVQRFLCEGRPSPGAVLLAPVPPTGVLPLFIRLLRSDPIGVARVLATTSLRHVVGDLSRSARLLFSETTDAATVREVHALLGDESFRVFVELLALRLDPAAATAPVAVLGAGADGIFTAAETRATAAAWGTSATFFGGVGHDMMLDVGWRCVAAATSRRARDIVGAARPMDVRVAWAPPAGRTRPDQARLPAAEDAAGGDGARVDDGAGGAGRQTR